MFKTALLVIVALIAFAYFKDPSSIKPWGEVANHVGVVVAKVVKDTGEVTNKTIRDEAHKDSVIEKTKDVVADVSDSVKEIVSGQ